MYHHPQYSPPLFGVSACMLAWGNAINQNKNDEQQLFLLPAAATSSPAERDSEYTGDDDEARVGDIVTHTYDVLNSGSATITHLKLTGTKVRPWRTFFRGSGHFQLVDSDQG